MLDRAAWAHPATPEEAVVAATFLRTATEMGLQDRQRLSDGEFQVFARLLTAYGYTRSELALAMREVPRDPDRFGGAGVTVQDVERVIRKHRDLRRTLASTEITREQKRDLLAAFPELSDDDFGKCASDKFGNALYVHGPTRRAITAERKAQADAPREGTNLVRLR